MFLAGLSVLAPFLRPQLPPSQSLPSYTVTLVGSGYELVEGSKKMFLVLYFPHQSLLRWLQSTSLVPWVFLYIGTFCQTLAGGLRGGGH